MDGTPDAGRLRQALAAIEAQRATLGDTATDLALGPLRQLLAQAEAAGAAPQLRRAQVTVLFADIVDSTALASRLDAEDVLQVFGCMLERAAACVQARGGRVLRYTGDGLKAGFGTQGTREDDAAQAVLAGLDILAAGREHAEWVARDHGIEGFALRVGAHTGEVALGAGFEADNTLTGDTVNIAARMEQAAPPGAMRISAETHAHVRGLFAVQAQAPLVVKGVLQPMQTWLVQRAHAGAWRRSARGIEGVPTRMIGRETELGLLQAAHARLFDERKFAAVTVVADAGVGKSRLLDEFDAWCRAQPRRVVPLRGGTTPKTEGQIFGLLRDVLARHFEIADDDLLDVARAKLERGVVPLFADDDGPDLAEGHAHLLGHLIGIEWRDSRHIKGILDDPRQLRSRALHVATQLFRRLAAREGCPLLLALEDLHWADIESLDFLDSLIDVNRDVPLLMLSFTRPTQHERRAAWSASAPHQRIDLAPLGPARSDELAAELLKKLPEVPAVLGELLSRHAEGNPFYMEELVKMLIDRGAIETGDPWRVDIERLVVTRVPTTLTGVLQARLDGLPAAEKRALQQASVVGPVFWKEAMAAIDDEAPAHLPALVRRGLTLPRAAASPDGLNEFAFHHQLLQQVTYGTVLKQDRRDGHAKVAHWLAGLQGLRSGDFIGTAAEHFDRAGDRDNAIEFHARAAEHASQRFAHARVQSHVGRALALLGKGPAAASPAEAELHWRLLSLREKTLNLQGRREEQAIDLEQLEGLADRMDDDRRRALVAERRSQRAMQVAEWDDAESAARVSLSCAVRAGDDGQRLFALRLLAAVKLSTGEIEACKELATRGLAEARGLGLPSVEMLFLILLALVAERQADVVGAMDLQRQALTKARETADRVNEAIVLNNVGWLTLNLGDIAQARRDVRAALQLLRANGAKIFEGVALGHLSAMALWQGDAAAAQALAQQSRDIQRAVKSRDMEVYANLRLGEAELALGHHAAAEGAYRQALTLALDIGSAEAHDARAGLARVALATADTDAAVDALRPVVDQVAGGGTLEGCDYERLVELTCFEALARAGDPNAAAWLARAHAALMAQADAIRDTTLRSGFLQNIPHHREIVAAWAQRPGADAPEVAIGEGA